MFGGRRVTTPSSARSPYQPEEAIAETVSLHQFPHPRRMALVESIRLVSKSSDNLTPKEIYQRLTEIVTEAILTCEMISVDDKNLIVMDGILEKRWDRVFQVYPPVNQDLLVQEEFPVYRKMMLALLKSSYNLQQLLPDESRGRIKQLILKTKSRDELNDLLERILLRTCGDVVKAKIMKDIVDGRYYRLVWPDRLHCEHGDIENWETIHSVLTEEDRKPAATGTANAVPYGSILLPDDLSHQQDHCPICLDHVQLPALKLSCHHVFCTPCISDWIVQQQHCSGQRSDDRTTGNEKMEVWYCPVCRQAHERH